MQSQMDDMQGQSEEMLEQKDIEYQQIIEQVQTECQVMIEEKEREADNGTRAGIKILLLVSPSNMLHTCFCHDWTLR